MYHQRLAVVCSALGAAVRKPLSAAAAKTVDEWVGRHWCTEEKLWLDGLPRLMRASRRSLRGIVDGDEIAQEELAKMFAVLEARSARLDAGPTRLCVVGPYGQVFDWQAGEWTNASETDE